jgi:hypothetical protein
MNLVFAPNVAPKGPQPLVSTYLNDKKIDILECKCPTVLWFFEIKKALLLHLCVHGILT